MQLIHPKVAQLKPGPFGFKSAIDHWLFGMDARQSAEKPLRKAQFADRAYDICLCIPPDRNWHKVNDPKVGL